MDGSGWQRGEDGLEPSSISSTLLDRLRARQPEAWQRLVDLYGPTVYRWCRLSGMSSEDAADVVQEVFTAVARRVGEFHRLSPDDSFGAWLWTISRNKIRDYYRLRRGRPVAEGGTHAQDRLLNLNAQEESSQLASGAETESSFLRRVLTVLQSEFENRTWTAFWLTVIDGRTPAETAERLGMSVPAVYKAKSRVLLRLREELGGLERGDVV